VARAVAHVAADRARAGRPLAVAWYRDTPYIIRHPGALPPAPLADPDAPLAELALRADAASLAAKLDACAAYASQLGFQFGGEPAMRAALDALAAAEAVRLGARAGDRAEVVAAGPRAAELLSALLGAAPAARPLKSFDRMKI
jgi:hypothetical protein